MLSTQGFLVNTEGMKRLLGVLLLAVSVLGISSSSSNAWTGNFTSGTCVDSYALVKFHTAFTTAVNDSTSNITTMTQHSQDLVTADGKLVEALYSKAQKAWQFCPKNNMAQERVASTALSQIEADITTIITNGFTLEIAQSNAVSDTAPYDMGQDMAAQADFDIAKKELPTLWNRVSNYINLANSLNKSSVNFNSLKGLKVCAVTSNTPDQCASYPNFSFEYCLKFSAGTLYQQTGSIYKAIQEFTGKSNSEKCSKGGLPYWAVLKGSLNTKLVVTNMALLDYPLQKDVSKTPRALFQLVITH